jgi:hypothetical protein
MLTSKIRVIGILSASLLLLATGVWIAWSQWTAPSAVEPQQGAAAPRNTPAGKYFIEGTVRQEQTLEAVSGAKIQFLALTETDPKRRMRKGTTDEQGRYRIEVPMGSVHFF